MMTFLEFLLQAALVAIAALSALVAILALFIVLHRMWNAATEQRQRSRQNRYEEPIALLVAGELEALPFVRLVRSSDRALVEGLLLEYAGKFHPGSRRGLGPVFGALGAVQRSRKQLRSRYWWRRAHAARQLGLMGDPTVSRSLSLLLRDARTEVRLAAARALVELGTDHWIDELLEALDQPDVYSNLRIADVILGAGPAAVPALTRFVAAGPDPRGAAVALNMLGDLRAPEAAPVVTATLSSPSKEVRAAACKALGRLESPGAVGQLCRALEDPAWEVRNQAVRALGSIADAEAIPAVVPLLREEHVWSVYRAAEALTLMGEAGVVALETELCYLQVDGGSAQSWRMGVLEEVLWNSKSQQEEVSA